MAIGLSILFVQLRFAQSASNDLDEVLKQAQEALVAKDFERAAREYRRALKLGPSAEIYEKLGLTHYLANAYPQAAEALKEAIRLDPKRWSAQLYLGVSLYKTNRFQEALPHIQRALELNPQQNESRYWLGSTYRALGNYDLASQHLRAALDQDPGNVDTLYALTEAYLDSSALLSKRLGPHDPDEKRREALQAQHGLQPETLRNGGSWDDAVHRLLKLEKQYADARNSPRTDPERVYVLSRTYAGLAQLTAERVWELKPDSFRAHQLLGETYEGNEKYEKALEEYRKALQLAPNVPGLHYSVGHCYWQMKRFDEAIPEIERELALNPRNASANFVLGHIYAYRQDLEKSSKYLQRAVEESPDFVEARKQLGKVLSLMQDNRGAVRQLEIAVASDPEDYSVHYLLAGVYRKLGLQDKARKELDIFNQLYSREHQHQHTAELPD